MKADNAAMICLKDVTFQYGEAGFRLHIDSLSIASSANVALVGPSGSGKTTLLHLLAGIFVPTKGHVEVAGHDMGEMSDASRRNFRIVNVGHVFQDFELVDYLNVRDNILLPFYINTQLTLDAATRRVADQLADSMGLGDKMRRPIGKLSQGERQRVAICRALLPRPRLILADEPTGNLDPENTQHVLDILLQRAASAGTTFVMVTHDHSLLPRFDRVVDFTRFLVEGAQSCQA
ncbi:MAG: ABC transporter ATP-binding protein [Pirellulaceae bacterium]|jgi:putative ABC transport system ATP-binding protein|nr:ABC transporter ATP-binding protein [Pirellulaceae bacterium]HJN13265.1 ABC transporter ATP-binding protein [Pirellulaceae bacterium]